MSFIEDDDLFKAVSFAASMVKKGTPVGLSCHKAAKYYKVSTHDVASELGKRGSSVANYKRKYYEKKS